MGGKCQLVEIAIVAGRLHRWQQTGAEQKTSRGDVQTASVIQLQSLQVRRTGLHVEKKGIILECLQCLKRRFANVRGNTSHETPVIKLRKLQFLVGVFVLAIPRHGNKPADRRLVFVQPRGLRVAAIVSCREHTLNRFRIADGRPQTVNQPECACLTAESAVDVDLGIDRSQISYEFLQMFRRHGKIPQASQMSAMVASCSSCKTTLSGILSNSVGKISDLRLSNAVLGSICCSFHSVS